MADLLKDKVAVITGSGRGIGKAMAELFVEEGAAVVINDIDAAPANETVEELKKKGGKAIACTGNVVDVEFDKKMMEAAVKEFGKLDILVNNAGYTWDAMAHTMADKQMDAMLDIHVKAPFHCIQAAAPYFRKKELKPGERGGKIVNITSIAGVMGNPGQANYSAGKAGLIGLTRTIAREWAPFKVNCNVIAYGIVETRLTKAVESVEKKEKIDIGEVKGVPIGVPKPMHEALAKMVPLGYAASPREAAGPVVFLASDLANYVSGELLLVTGGLLMNQ